MSPRARRVRVGVPVWHGGDYMAEALESLLKQRGVDVRIVVSVDGADETSVAACRPFLTDPRVSLIVQSRRLGWVGNSSAALAAAAADGDDYAGLHPHDDVAEDDYLAVLVEALEARPAAGVVYSDIQCFGARDTVYRQPTVAGSPMQRQIDLMRHHFGAVSYRGLMRVPALRSILPMTGNACDDFAADTVWMSRQALVGDLIRVPRPLYRKRYHANNTHTQWAGWPAERRMAAWLTHCLDMLATALKVARTPGDVRMLHRAARTRLLYARVATPYRGEVAALTAAARRALRLRFEAAAAARADIGAPPEMGLRAAVRAVGRIVAARLVSGSR